MVCGGCGCVQVRDRRAGGWPRTAVLPSVLRPVDCPTPPPFGCPCAARWSWAASTRTYPYHCAAAGPRAAQAQTAKPPLQVVIIATAHIILTQHPPSARHPPPSPLSSASASSAGQGACGRGCGQEAILPQGGGRAVVAGGCRVHACASACVCVCVRRGGRQFTRVCVCAHVWRGGAKDERWRGTCPCVLCRRAFHGRGWGWATLFAPAPLASP